MNNKQLAVIVGSIFLAVLLAYQLFVGFDFRSDAEKRNDKASAELEEFQRESLGQACADISAAGGKCDN